MRITRLKALACAALALAACGGRGESLNARYSAEQCRRLPVSDRMTGKFLSGAEDFAVDWASGRLFFTAYDRRAVEKAAREKADTLPQGGVYAAPLSLIFSPNTQFVDAAPLAAPSDIKGGLHPHGVAYDAANHELIFINRAYEKVGRKWVMTPRLQRIGSKGEVVVGEADAAHCAANSVALIRGELFTTYDHAACNWRATMEDLFRTKESGLADKNGVLVYDKAAFANGLAQTMGGDIVMAATREKALLFLSNEGGRIRTVARIDLPGGPDNLMIAEDGDIIAAVHPAMMRLAFNRKLGFGKAPSRIVRVDPEARTVDTLFDDTKGSLFSAATVAVETDEGLIAGSVTDDGFLVCRAKS